MHTLGDYLYMDEQSAVKCSTDIESTMCALFTTVSLYHSLGKLTLNMDDTRFIIGLYPRPLS